MTPKNQSYLVASQQDSRLFSEIRSLILQNTGNYRALSSICFPDVTHFNWATDWFDLYATGNHDECVVGASIFGDWNTLTYSEVSEKSSTLAADLQRTGLSPGERVLIESTSNIEIYVLLIALLKLGCVIVPVHHGLEEDAFNDRLTVCDPSWVITDVERSIGEYRVLRFSELFTPRRSVRSYLPQRRSADLPAFGCFTSGTTGRPKLVLHSHRTHGVAHLSSLAWNDLLPGDRHLNISSPGWAKFFWSSFLVPLTSGATVVVKNDALQGEDLVEFCNMNRVSSVCAPVPFLLRAVKNTRSRPTTVKDITTVGEAVPEQLISAGISQWGIAIRTGYGQSEATAILGELKCRPGVLSVLPGYAVRVREQEGNPAARLEYRSFDNGSFLGYRRDDSLIPPEVDSCGWQWSGDYASGTPGTDDFKILGRGNDVFRVNGHLVSPTEIEHIFLRHPRIKNAAVAPWEDSDGITHVVAHVIHSKPHEFSEESLLYWINRRLPGDVSVSRIIRVDVIPVSINGKIQRTLLSSAHQT